MFAYIERVVAAETADGQRLEGLAKQFQARITPLVSGQLYKVWVSLWSLSSGETWNRMLHFDGEPAQHKLVMYAPAYVSFLHATRPDQVDLLAFDHEAILGIRDWLRKTWRIKPPARPPLIQRIPLDIEVEGISRSTKAPKAQIIENFGVPVRLEGVWKELGASGSALTRVTVWADRKLGSIRLYNVMLQEMASEIQLQIENLVPEDEIFKEKEGEFIKTIADLCPLFYSGNPEDVRKACKG